MIRVFNDAPNDVLSFVHQDKRDKVFAMFNFSDRPRVVTFAASLRHGTYTEYFSGETAVFDAAAELEVERWGYRVFVK